MAEKRTLAQIQAEISHEQDMVRQMEQMKANHIKQVKDKKADLEGPNPYLGDPHNNPYENKKRAYYESQAVLADTDSQLQTKYLILRNLREEEAKLTKRPPPQYPPPVDYATQRPAWTESNVVTFEGGTTGEFMRQNFNKVEFENAMQQNNFRYQILDHNLYHVTLSNGKGIYLDFRDFYKNRISLSDPNDAESFKALTLLAKAAGSDEINISNLTPNSKKQAANTIRNNDKDMKVAGYKPEAKEEEEEKRISTTPRPR